MAEKTPQQKNDPSKSISDSESSDEEIDSRLCTSVEERVYSTIRGLATATQIALTHTMAQTNPTVETGPACTPKIKSLPKEKAMDQTTQTDTTDLNQHNFKTR